MRSSPVSRGSVVFLALAIALATGCGKPISDKYVIEDEPAILTDIPDSELKIVTLTDMASVRLGIETSVVTTHANGFAVPSSALWMDTDGVFWVYMNPGPNVFQRHAVDVIDDDGRVAVFTSGPPVETPIVTIGVPELYGTEVGVGK